MDSGDAVLRAATRAWRATRDAGDPTWSVPGGYPVDGGTLGPQAGEFVVWVAAAVGSGVLGNAAYDAMKALVGRVRDPGSPAVLGRDDVQFLARLAVRVALLHNGLDDSGPIEITGAVWEPDSGRWRVEAAAGVRTFRFTLPDRQPQDVLVAGAPVRQHPEGHREEG